jgi:hypothetical protein
VSCGLSGVPEQPTGGVREAQIYRPLGGALDVLASPERQRWQLCALHRVRSKLLKPMLGVGGALHFCLTSPALVLEAPCTFYIKSA